MRFVYHYDIGLPQIDAKKVEKELRKSGWLTPIDKITFLPIQGNSYIGSIVDDATPYIAPAGE